MGISIYGLCRQWRDRRWESLGDVGGPELVRTDACWRQQLPWTRVNQLPEAVCLRLEAECARANYVTVELAARKRAHS